MKMMWATALLLTGCVTPMHIPLPPEPTAKPSAAFCMPLPGARILSPFGPRGKRYHTGIDLQVNRRGGDPVHASRAGLVTRAAVLQGYGKLVEIQHADGFSTRYAHLRKFQVKKGERVIENQVIGFVGQTGRATAPHLHFEILTPKYRFMDPKSLIFK